MIPFQSPTDVTPFSGIVYQSGLTEQGGKKSGYDNFWGSAMFMNTFKNFGPIKDASKTIFRRCPQQLTGIDLTMRCPRLV